MQLMLPLLLLLLPPLPWGRLQPVLLLLLLLPPPPPPLPPPPLSLSMLLVLLFPLHQQQKCLALFQLSYLRLGFSRERRYQVCF